MHFILQSVEIIFVSLVKCQSLYLDKRSLCLYYVVRDVICNTCFGGFIMWHDLSWIDMYMYLLVWEAKLVFFFCCGRVLWLIDCSVVKICRLPITAVSLNQVPPCTAVLINQVPPCSAVPMNQVPPFTAVPMSQVPPWTNFMLVLQLPWTKSLLALQLPWTKSHLALQLPWFRSLLVRQLPWTKSLLYRWHSREM